MTTYKPERVCEACGRSATLVQQQDEPPATIKLRRYGQNVLMLCDRCYSDNTN